MFLQLAVLLLSFTFESSANTLQSGCDVKFSDLKHSIEYVWCPSDCWVPEPRICGNNIYGDGSVCRSALHAGAVAATGGVAKVYKGGIAAPSGSSIYGVKSPDCTSPQQTYSFEMTCHTLGEARFGINEVRCPPGCNGGVQVCGTKVYSGSSHVCAAAVHAGNISAAVGGKVKFYRVAKQLAYESSTKNGVQTSTNCPPSNFAFTFQPTFNCPRPTNGSGCGSSVAKGLSNDMTMILLAIFIGLTVLFLIGFIVAIVCCKKNRGKLDDKENLMMIGGNTNPNMTSPKKINSGEESCENKI